MSSIKIGGREIPLTFTMLEFALIEEEVGPLSDIQDLIQTDKHRVRNIVRCLTIMGNGGLSARGEKADLTEDGVMRACRPGKLKDFVIAIFEAISEGMQMETEEEKEHDIFLEEIQRKKGPGD